MYSLLRDSEIKGYTDCIRWNSSGDSFVVQNIPKFTDAILPKKLFGQDRQFLSFGDALLYFGFEIISSDSDKNSCKYRHPLFIRGHVNGLDYIIPRNINTTKANSKANNALFSAENSFTFSRSEAISATPPGCGGATISVEKSKEEKALHDGDEKNPLDGSLSYSRLGSSVDAEEVVIVDTNVASDKAPEASLSRKRKSRYDSSQLDDSLIEGVIIVAEISAK